MTEYKIKTDTILISLATGCDIKNITNQINQKVIESTIERGMVNIFVVGSTGSVTTIEYEPGVVEDLKRAIDEIAPAGLEYEHEKA
ncbi:MAG: YjbQ family protein, partial [Desulfobacteraceae bacterium]|nr:YjbQ family protein [Desulfobacteraceae bacterium]